MIAMATGARNNFRTLMARGYQFHRGTMRHHGETPAARRGSTVLEETEADLRRGVLLAEVSGRGGRGRRSIPSLSGVRRKRGTEASSIVRARLLRPVLSGSAPGKRAFHFSFFEELGSQGQSASAVRL